MNHLILDTETTSKADMRADPSAPHQPHIVQLAAILMDDAAKEIMSMNVIIKPEGGWTIPDEAAAIHGITTKFATEVGVPIATALKMLSAMKESAWTYVAHNVSFDKFLIICEVKRITLWRPESMPDKKWFCTMEAMTPICNLPGPFGPKWPKLIEAYKHAFGEGFDGAHDALTDVRAAARLFFWLREQKAKAAAEAEKVQPVLAGIGATAAVPEAPAI